MVLQILSNSEKKSIFDWKRNKHVLTMTVFKFLVVMEKKNKPIISLI